MNSFDRGHKTENILFILLLDTNASNLLETWPRVVGTAKLEHCATCCRERSTNSSAMKEKMEDQGLILCRHFIVAISNKTIMAT